VLCAVALKACQAGISIYFTNMENLIAKLEKTMLPDDLVKAEAITSHRL
jgi:DNA replication protein DnaC